MSAGSCFPCPVDVYAEEATDRSLWIHVENLVLVAISVDLYLPISLAESVVLPAMLVNLVDVPVLPRDEDGSSFYSAGVFQPVGARVCGAFPVPGDPLSVLLVCTGERVIKSIRLPGPGANAHEVEVPVTGGEHAMTKSLHALEDGRHHQPSSALAKRPSRLAQ